MTAFTGIPSLDPILAAIADSNPHDGPARAGAMDPRRSVVCLAPAGSGKTSELIYRMLACLAISTRPEEVLAITFTTLAAGEIKERLIGALSLAATGIAPTQAHELQLFELARLVLRRDSEMGWNLLFNPSRLRVMTFDSFSAYLAGKTPIMSGLGGGQTTDDPHLIYRQAILETLGSVNDPSIPDELREALEAVLGFAKNQFEKLVPMFGTLLAKRDQWAPEIIDLDVSVMEQALGTLVGESKLECLAALRNGHIDALVNVVADAAGELSGFEWAANVPAVTDAKAYLEFLRGFSGFFLKADGDLRATVNARNGFPAGLGLTKRCNEVLKELKGTPEAEAYALAMRTLVSLPDEQFPDFSAQMVRHFTIILRYLLANLTLAFEDTASLDFPEVAARAIQALGTETEVGDAMLDEDRINHILVDEVQDSSPNQYRLLERITADWAEGDGRSIFFCGDPFQSIYLFRNATPEIFNKIVKTKAFGGIKLELFRLVVNFRSLPGVVDWNNQCYEKVFAESATEFVPSVPARTGDGGMTVRPISTGRIGEATEVADRIEQLLQQDPDATIAILVRARSHMKYILPELKSRGISASGQNIDPINESAPVSEVIAMIRALWHLADRTSWFALLRSAFVGLSWDDCIAVAQGPRIVLHALSDEQVQSNLSADGMSRVTAFLNAYDAVRSSTRGDDLAWASKALWVSLGGPASVDSTEIDDVLTVFTLLLQHTATGCLEKPQAFFRAVNSLYAAPRPGRVMVMTIHNSKGLEFDHVLIPGLNNRSGSDDTPLFYWRRVNDSFVLAPNPGPDYDKASPEMRLFSFIGKAVKNDIREEVARLAYVMTTRAKKTCDLFVTMQKLDDDTMAFYASGSLLECLWPAVEEQVSAMPPGIPIKEEEVIGVPSKARLPAGFMPALPKVFIPASSNDQVPTENELVDELKEAQGDDLRARLEGIVYHKMVELIGQSGVEGWGEDRVLAKAKAIDSMLRREGYPSRDVQSGVERIIRLVNNTLRSKTGQWILKRRGEGGQEVQVSSYRGGRWVHRIIDRPFVEDGVYWVVDWKTPEPEPGKCVDSFVAREVQRYKAKMQEYRQAVQDAGVTLPVKLALYFPAIDVLSEVA
jgi:ATP-dependent helicase/nuclease subunit A